MLWFLDCRGKQQLYNYEFILNNLAWIILQTSWKTQQLVESLHWKEKDSTITDNTQTTWLIMQNICIYTNLHN